VENKRLVFGIDRLDALLSGTQTELGIETSSADGTSQVTSICIAGPDGTGKSVLALHVAARYAADACRNKPKCVRPKIIYASTDLRYSKAEKVFYNFMLDFPHARPSPFSDAWFQDVDPIRNPNPNLRVDFKKYNPGIFNQPPEGEGTLSDYVCEAEEEPAIAFVDLADYTAGDDWMFLNRLLACLDDNQTPHMLVIDAVEGLETFGGDLDTYGETQSRRARVAQLMRAAGSKCHVVLVVEEADPKIRLPEDYVADVVIRLRSVPVEVGGHGYLRRTVEIEKARAQVHTRGQHLITYRKGQGTWTGRQFNPDDPVVMVRFGPNHTPVEWKRFANTTDVPVDAPTQGAKARDEGWHQMAYVHVLPSLDAKSRAPGDETVAKGKKQRVEAENSVAARRNKYKLGFGIHYLDDVLSKSTAGEKADWKGLSCGDMTALIGEHGSHRNRLANAFLSRCFRHDRKEDIAILISTQAVTAEDLAVHLNSHSVPGEPKLKAVPERVICRQLEVHDMTSSVLLHIVASAVAEAKRLLNDPTEKIPGRIRLVLSDLEQMRDTYPGAVDDPLFLPALRQYLAREGVTSIVVQTDSAGPERSKQSNLTHMLYAASRHSLYTWLVPFFGELRVAIAAIPQINDDTRPIVRELKAAGPNPNDQRLSVDPHFELYKGILENGTPEMVPLQVHLWGKGPQFDSYAETITQRYMSIFGEMTGRRPVVRPGNDLSYEDVRSAIYFRGDMRLDQTLVVQVDEFWHSHHGELANVSDYLFATTVRTRKAVPENDPYRVFQFTTQDLCEAEDFFVDNPNSEKPRVRVVRHRREEWDKVERENPNDKSLPKPDDDSALRADFFAPFGYGYSYYRARQNHQIDRVPYFWDFGMLLLRQSLWEAAGPKEFRFDYRDPDKMCSVRDVWERLLKVEALPIVGGEKSGTSMNLRPNELDDQCASESEGNRYHAGLDVRIQRLLDEVPPPQADASSEQRKDLQGPLSWRTFLHACTVVQRTSGAERDGQVLAFDLDVLSPESLCCLLIEVWASTIADSHGDSAEEFFKEQDAPDSPRIFARRRSEPMKMGLDDLLVKHLKEFFLTWILLGETMTAKQFEIDWFEPPGRRAYTTAVAARHWYASASIVQPVAAADDPLIPARLPGHFSVRGDWFLGVAAGSQSTRLGERAIDIMSTRKANLDRLKGGVGLPVRDLGDDEVTDNAPTHLVVRDNENRRRLVTYGEIRRLGSFKRKGFEDPGRDPQRFYWLWRYTMTNYDRHAPVFAQMTSALLKKTPHYWDAVIRDFRTGKCRNDKSEGKQFHPRTGFEAYDHLLQMSVKDLENLESFREFEKDCLLWIRRLRDSSFPQDK